MEIDIIILSYAYNDDLIQMTNECVSSLVESETSSNMKFNIVVLESNKLLKPYQFPSTTTIYPEQKFGFHSYLNIGINITSSSYICLCNNDLKFHKYWATEIIKYMDIYPDVFSASPICSIYHPSIGFKLYDGISFGYRVGYELAGWCLFLRRDIFALIGKLDENYVFSGADYDFSYTLWVRNIKHALVSSSIVDHLTGRTLITQSKERQDDLTNQITYHMKKWKSRIDLK